MNQHSLKLITEISRNIFMRSARSATISSFILKNDICSSCGRNKNFLNNTVSFGLKSPSFMEKVVDKVKFNFGKHKLHVAGYYLYECVADNVDYDSFMKEFNLPDTFKSWFLVTELHIWMLMVRLMADPKQGRIVRNAIVEALWKDVVTRSKKLGSEQTAIVKSQIMQLSEEFQAALVSYDEGILCDDTVLASAVWRRILSRECEAKQLEAMVKYVRQTMFYLDKLCIEEFLTKRKIKWIPLNEVFKSLPP